MCRPDDFPPYSARDMVLLRLGLPVGDGPLPVGGQPVAYTNVTGEDYVMAEKVPPLRADEAPFWAVIHPSGYVTFVHGRPGAGDLHHAVGGYLEAVPGTLPEYVAFCDEDGKGKGWVPNLPATRFVGLEGDYLAGPVALVGPEVDGELTPLPDAIRARLVHEVIEGGSR